MISYRKCFMQMSDRDATSFFRVPVSDTLSVSVLSRRWIRTHPQSQLILFFFPIRLLSRQWIRTWPDAILSVTSSFFLIRRCCLYFCFRQKVSQRHTTHGLSSPTSCLIGRHFVWDTTKSFLLSCLFIMSNYLTFSYTSKARKYWIGTRLCAFDCSLLTADISLCYVIRSDFINIVRDCNNKIVTCFTSFLFTLDWVGAAFHIFHLDREHDLTCFCGLWFFPPFFHTAH